MTITAIRRQVRNANRYAIYIDGTYSFSLNADSLLSTKLVPGQTLSATQLAEYQKLAADDKVYTLALAYAVRRLHSRWELTDYLRRKGCSGDAATAVLAKLERLGFVDDRAFAEAWVRNRRRLKAVSIRRLTQELHQKHIAEDTITAVLAADQTDERAVLHELVARKRAQARYQDTTKLMQYLSRQGFSYDDIKAALAQEAD